MVFKIFKTIGFKCEDINYIFRCKQCNKFEDSFNKTKKKLNEEKKRLEDEKDSPKHCYMDKLNNILDDEDINNTVITKKKIGKNSWRIIQKLMINNENNNENRTIIIINYEQENDNTEKTTT
ncbi:hypothetical protein U3516DRAFT_758121 [Neocallimastix sp. 'constans']